MLQSQTQFKLFLSPGYRLGLGLLQMGGQRAAVSGSPPFLGLVCQGSDWGKKREKYFLSRLPAAAPCSLLQGLCLPLALASPANTQRLSGQIHSALGQLCYPGHVKWAHFFPALPCFLGPFLNVPGPADTIVQWLTRIYLKIFIST